MLRERFVVGWHNIWRETYVGQSHGYSRHQQAIGTTNGAGGRNMQVFVLSPDLVVLHALPGFWHPEDFAHELRFAEGLASVWADDTITRAQKDDLFRRVQLAEVRSHGAATYARSGWQHFDAHAERMRAKDEVRDTLSLATPAGPAMKPVNVLVHERMADRPFVPFASFDVRGLVDYGQSYYDNNRARGHTGITFPKPQPKRNHWL